MKIEVDYIPLGIKECEELKKEAKKHIKREWGSMKGSKDGEQLYYPLNKLETSHLENILISQPQVPPLYKATILHILKERIKRNYQDKIRKEVYNTKRSIRFSD